MVHQNPASLLPRFRGAAFIQAAIDAGNSETAITAMHVVRELNAGEFILANKDDRRKRLKIFPPTQILSLENPAGQILNYRGQLVVGCGAAAL